MRYLVLSTVTLAALALNSWAGQNLLPNGGFEEGATTPTGWSFAVWSSKPSRGSFEWSTDARSGKRAAALIGLENAGAESVRGLLHSPPIEVKEGLLKLKGWYKTRGDGMAHIQVSVYAEDFSAKQFGTPAQETLYRNFDAAAEWTPFDFDINAKPGARQVLILLRATDIGVVYYDDVSLERVDDPLILRLYPAEFGRNNTLPLVRGAPNFARVMLMGDREQIKSSAELVLDLPEGAGDFGLLGTLTSVEREGHRFTRFRMRLSPETLRGLQKTISHCSVTLWVDAGTMADEGTVYYRAVVNGKELPEKEARVQVLPALPSGPRPRRFHGFICWGLLPDVPEQLRPAVYDVIRSMGVDHHLAAIEPTGWTKYLLDRLRADGGTLWANIPGQYEKATAGKGWETHIIAKGKSFFSDLDQGYFQRMAASVDGVFWDWEPENAMHNPLWDDPPTVAAFARKEGLDVGALTEERLKGELRDRLLKFRTWQLGEVVRLWADHIHELRPDLTIALCQGAGMPPDRYVDYKAYDDIPHLVHLPMIYTNSPMDFARNVAGMHEYLPKARLFPMTSSGMVADIGWLAAKSPRALYFDYVSSAMLGCIGCSHWPDLCRGFDMEYVWEISRAMRDIGCVEEFLFDGERNPKRTVVNPLPESEARIKTARGEVTISSPQWDRSALCSAYRLKQSTLVSVCNMHADKLATVKVCISDAKGAGWFVCDPVTKAALVPASGKVWKGSDLAKGILYEVPAASLGMLVVAQQPPSGGLKGETRESTVRRRFEARCAQAKAAGDITAFRAGELEINWADMDGDGYAEIRMASKHQEIGIGPSGNLWCWKASGRKEDLVNRFDGGGACQDQFWWPEAARTSEDKRGEYELVTREIKGGRATVAFRRALSHWSLGGLIIEKSYSFTEEGSGFEVRVTIRNESPDPREFSYWSHNCLHVGGTPTLVFMTAEGQRVFRGYEQPREIWAPLAGIAPDQTELITEPSTATLTECSFALGEPSSPHIEVKADASVLQLYRWWDGTSQGRYTLEWMYQRQKLLSGQVWSTRFTMAWK